MTTPIRRTVVKMAAAAIVVSATFGPPGGAMAEELAISVANFQNNVLSLPDYIATQEGIFKAKGLAVEMIGIESGPAGAALVAGGSADVGKIGADTLLSLLDKGQNFKVLAGFQKSDLELVVAKDSAAFAGGARKVADLKGATIGVPARASLAERFVSTLLVEAGLDPAKDVTFLAVGAAPTQVAALKAQRVDGVASTAAINVQVAAAGIDLEKFASSADGTGGAFGNGIVFNVPMVRPETAENKKEALQLYCASEVAVNSWIADPQNREKFLSYAQEWLKLKDPRMVEAAAGKLPSLLVGAMTEEIWNKQLSLLPQFKTQFSDVTYGPCADL